MVEYWNAEEQRWQWADAQLDDFQCEQLKVNFNPLDIKPGHFLTGGQAWQMCRSGSADPDRFGIFDMHGWGFIRGNVLRDLASLNKVELLPWDLWGVLLKRDEEMIAEVWALVDRAAAAAQMVYSDFAGMRALFEGEAQLRVPQVIRSWVNGAMQTVDVNRLES